jgi:hypothetical protein
MTNHCSTTQQVFEFGDIWCHFSSRQIWGKLYSKIYVLQATPESGSWPINFPVYNRSEDRERGAKTVQEPPNRVIVVLLKVTFA